MSDQDESVQVEDQPKTQTDEVTGSPKPEFKDDNKVPAALLKEWISKHAEEKQSKEALKQELARVRQLALDEEEYLAYQELKEKKAKDAEERKKKDGKWEQLLIEKEQEWSSRLKDREEALKRQVEELERKNRETEKQIRDQLVYGRVNSTLKGMCADDVIDIVSRTIVEGSDSDYRIDLDEENNLVVVDKRSGTRAWGSQGHLSIEDYVESYLSKRPSLRKARVNPGSDTGNSVPDSMPVPTLKDPSSESKPIEYAKNLSLIKDGVSDLFSSQKSWFENRAR